MLKVATFNVNSLRARLNVVYDWLQVNRPDILAVQETKVQDADFPGADFDAIGYRYVFRGQKSYNGVAVFSRSAISNVRFGLLDESRDEPRLVAAETCGVHIVNTYVPQGDSPASPKYAYKLAWFVRLREFFEARFRPDQPILWGGDLNVAPEAIDVYDPVALLGHVCFNPEVSIRLSDVRAWGFTDLFRMHCGQPGQYTFWDYRMRDALKQNRGWRLDHIMGTPPLAQRCTACYIDKGPRAAERPSDHTPLVAEFDL